ncbi:N-acetylglucosamine-6-phosphate deacetylase [Candidatus Poribacteria bacterium]|nr:N-acetylglucosamine-6-phosphate deacetylase [Candidatus Poribacteria bacterium]
MMSKKISIKKGRVITPQGILDGATVVVEDGLITQITPNDVDVKAAEVINATGLYVSPGFIDIHVHGGKGSDTMDGTVEDILNITTFHSGGGTTSILPTTASDSLERLIGAIEAARVAKSKQGVGARILGLHLEGPYFNPNKKGCHLGRFVRNPEPLEYQQLLKHDAMICSMTLAPELPGAMQLIKALTQHGIIASCGHSEASYEQMVEAVSQGVKHTTHLYCAMSGIIREGAKRQGGIVESALLLDELTTEVIADGKHLPPELIQLAIKCKTTGGVALVTDAMRGAGMPDGIYTFGAKDGTQAIVKDGEAKMPDGSGYASSVVRMNDMIKVMRDIIGVPLKDAVKMASLTPARILGVDDKFGSIKVGKYGDIVLLDEELNVKKTMVGGILLS